MQEKVIQALIEAGLDPAGGMLLLGVSGGPDSLSMLQILLNSNYKIAAAHLNHGLREEAEGDAKFVQDICKEFEVSFYLSEVDTKNYAEKNRKSIEEAARFLRYQFLFRKAEELKAQAVLVAHNADDQVETVLMHLLRGSGLAGLKGMQLKSYNPNWSQDISLVRPLLNVWRDEILRYCEENRLTPRFDQSNLDKTYFRNRLRHDLLPYLEEYNPQVKQVIWRMAQTLEGDYDLFEEIIEKAWDELVLEVSGAHVLFDYQSLQEQATGLQRGILRKAVNHLCPGLRDIDFAVVERAIDFIKNPSSTKQVDLAAGLKLELDGDRLLLVEWDENYTSPEWPQMGENTIEVSGDSKIDLEHGWQVIVEQTKYKSGQLEQIKGNQDDFVAWIDANRLEGNLILRTLKSGDRIQPLGMEGTTKIADLFINLKIPYRARKSWPLVCSGDKIVWFPGYRIADSVRLTDSSRNIIKIEVSKKEHAETKKY